MNAKNLFYMAFHQQGKTQIHAGTQGWPTSRGYDFQYLSEILGPEHRAGCEDKKSYGIGSMKETTKNVEIKTIKTHIKIQLFQATVEGVLFYGVETWTITKKIGKALDGCYTRML